MTVERAIEQRLCDLARRFAPNPRLADAVMAEVGASAPGGTANIGRWAMRSAIGLGIAACVAAIVLLVGAEPSVAEFDLPARKQLQWMALGKLPDYDVSVTPAVEP